MRAARYWPAAALAAFVGACTLAGGCVEQTLTLKTDPPGALVTANDQELGRTPVTQDFTIYGNYDLIFRLDGYETLKVHQNVNSPWWMLVPLDLISELQPFWIKDHRRYSYKLSVATTQDTDPKAMEARAKQYEGMLESSQYTHAPITHVATTQHATTAAATTAPVNIAPAKTGP